MTEWYLQKKQAGGCVRCGKTDEKVLAGKVYCAECAGKMLEATKERRKYLRGQNRCIHCGRRDERTEAGRVACADCTRKIKAHPSTAVKEERFKAKMKALRAERLAAHVCTECGGVIDEDGFRICSGCRRKAREKRNNAGMKG